MKFIIKYWNEFRKGHVVLYQDFHLDQKFIEYIALEEEVEKSLLPEYCVGIWKVKNLNN